MAHDRHLVQRGLPIEQDVVTILKVSLDFVADFQVDVRAVAQHAQINLPLIVADDVLGTWPLAWTVDNEGSELVNVLSSHNLRHSQAHCDHVRHSQLVKVQIRIRSDDRSGRKVDSLAHQVASQTSFFALEARPDALNHLA